MHIIETKPADAPDAADALTVALDSVLATDELYRRPSRAPDYEAENVALTGLAAALGTSPQELLLTLVSTTLALCRAHSSGISLMDEENGEKVFRWPAIAGAWAKQVGGTTPRYFSPCGVVIDRNAAQLFVRFGRYYPYFNVVSAPPQEALLIPFHLNGEAIGTLWVVAHDDSRHFDAEDHRLLASMGKFASAAFSQLSTHERSVKMETSLRESEERATLAFEVARLGTWSWQPGVDVLTADSRCREICGLDPRAPLSFSSLGSLLHADDRIRVMTAIQSASSPSGTGDYSEDLCFRSVDGKPRWIVARGHMRFDMIDGTRQAAMMVGTVLDITERKATEDALHEAHRLKDVFLATLAHELRNPLAPIRNSVQILKLLKDKNDTTGAADMAGAIMERQLAEMARLIDDLLDVSRISQGKIELRPERVEIGSIIQRALETSRPMIDARQHSLTIERPEVPAFLHADPGRLAQVIANILNNAAKYTDNRGHIRLSVKKDGSNLVISVKDNGIGISEELLPHVFDTFTQGTRSLDKAQGGLGVGLSIAKKLVELHGGRIEIASEGNNTGSEFIVTLPGSLSSRESGALEHSAAPALPLLRRRILVVEDNRDSADSLAMMLGLMGNETKIAQDGVDALGAAPVYQPDVIVMDIGMPRLNGYDTARQIRKQPWADNVVLIALTGWGHTEDKRRAKEAGFDHHMVKPVDPVTLERIINIALAQSSTKRPVAHDTADAMPGHEFSEPRLR